MFLLGRERVLLRLHAARDRVASTSR